MDGTPWRDHDPRAEIPAPIDGLPFKPPALFRATTLIRVNDSYSTSRKYTHCRSKWQDIPRSCSANSAWCDCVPAKVCQHTGAGVIWIHRIWEFLEKHLNLSSYKSPSDVQGPFQRFPAFERFPRLEISWNFQNLEGLQIGSGNSRNFQLLKDLPRLEISRNFQNLNSSVNRLCHFQKFPAFERFPSLEISGNYQNRECFQEWLWNFQKFPAFDGNQTWKKLEFSGPGKSWNWI